MNVVRASIKGVLVIVTICALPFLIELFLNAYELNRNPWAKPGAIVTDGGAVKAGLNRREFNEIRFRSTGLRMYFSAVELSEAQVDALVADVSGTLRVLQDGQEQLAYTFKLKENLRRNVGGLDLLQNLSGAAVMDIAQKFDVECRIVPVNKHVDAEADQLELREFGVAEAVELAFMFEGDIPPGSTLRFSYSQCPRSFLHGTFLERVADWFQRLLI